MAVAVDHFKSVIGDEFKDLNQIHPKGVLIVGDSSGLTERKKASFNFFRQGPVSYTHLDVYKRQNDSSSWDIPLASRS